MTTMDRSPQYMQGYRHAAKAAVEWLHRRADEMNHQSAKSALNTAAFTLGTQFSRNAAPSPPHVGSHGLMEETAKFLWDLLDNIDTLDDACREDDAAFRVAAYKQQRRRFEVGSTDGFTVAFSARTSRPSIPEMMQDQPPPYAGVSVTDEMVEAALSVWSGVAWKTIQAHLEKREVSDPATAMRAALEAALSRSPAPVAVKPLGRDKIKLWRSLRDRAGENLAAFAARSALVAHPADDVRNAAIEECAQVADRIAETFLKDGHVAEACGGYCAAECIRNLRVSAKP